jgi:hypothetical protein
MLILTYGPLGLSSSPVRAAHIGAVPLPEVKFFIFYRNNHSNYDKPKKKKKKKKF